MRLTGEFVYCAAIGHRQIVKLTEAKQIDDGRYLCLTCFHGHMTLERGQRIKGADVEPNGHTTL